MTDNNNNGGVRSTSVSVTLNGKSLGVDAFIKLEETFEFSDAASEADAIFKRDEVSSILTDQILASRPDLLHRSSISQPRNSNSINQHPHIHQHSRCRR